MTLKKVTLTAALFCLFALAMATGCENAGDFVDFEGDEGIDEGIDEGSGEGFDEMALPLPEEGVVVDNVPDGDAPEEEDSAFRYWTGYTSEEFPPLVCPSEYWVRGFHCSGSYCDNLRINCTDINRRHGESSWTRWFSEEGQNWEYCDYNEFVTGVSCRGKYCDQISMECTVMPGKKRGSCGWSGWYSEEQGNYYAPANRYVRGIHCSGSYCDNKRYYSCTYVNN